MAAPETIGDAVRALAARFRDAGLTTPALDARLLVGAATAKSAERLILDAVEELQPEEARRVSAFAVRRLAREPVSRIVGERGFYGRLFTISADVLDPRPETELVVTHALDIARILATRRAADRPITILDVGVGSGAIIVSLLAEDARLKGIGIDISSGALGIARRNAEQADVSARLALFECAADAVETLTFDLVVANLPYIQTSDLLTLEPDVRLYDPISALDGGSDGFDVYRALFRSLARARFKGPVVTEVGAGQAVRVIEMAHQLWPHSEALQTVVARDLEGHARCVLFRPHG